MHLESFSVCLATYLSGGDGHLDLTTGSRHDLTELLADTTEDAKTVVLGEGVEEVLDGGVLASARLLGELSDDGRLVLGGEGRSGEDGGQLGILLHERTEACDGAGGRVEA